jgi:hypothetical protein
MALRCAMGTPDSRLSALERPAQCTREGRGLAWVSSRGIGARLAGGRVTSYSPIFIAILATMAMELRLSPRVAGKWPHLASVSRIFNTG